jgi:hypothetical protein
MHLAETHAGKNAWYIGRVWHGASFGVWLRLLASNGFAVSPSRLPLVVGVTVASLFNSALRLISEAVHRRRAAQVRPQPPLFILGHWRTGTTLLQELLARDKRFTYPSTYACLEPHHFLLSGRFLPRIFRFMLPSQRPMDAMPMGWERPQEDEFALCLLGADSSYLSLAFPRHTALDATFDIRAQPEMRIRRWKRRYLWFLRRLTLHDSRRLVLKSPPHTARIAILLDLFPDARFVHLVRDPFQVVPSSLHMWQQLSELMGLQSGGCPDRESRVFDAYVEMYRRFEEDRHLLAPGQMCEMRYEDLIADPLRQMQRLYRELSLGDFATARDDIAGYLDSIRGYRTNHYELPAQLRERIADVWRDYIERYGYRDIGVRQKGESG